MSRRCDGTPFAEVAAAPGGAAVVDRAARLPHFVGVSAASLARLTELVVLIAGVGSIGRNLALHLARLGILALYLVDWGRYKAESLLTQPVDADELGLPKASATGRRAKALSPRTRVFAFDGPLQELAPLDLDGVDLVLLATDNLAAEIAAAQLAQRAGVPLLHGAVHGETLVGQVRVFPAGGEHACLLCGLGPAEWQAAWQQVRYSCEDGRAQPDPSAPPTVSVSFHCALVADLLLIEMLRHALGLAPAADGASLLEYAGYPQTLRRVPLARRPDCPGEHAGWQRRALPRALAQCSPAELLAAAGAEAGASLQVAGHAFATRAACGCSAQRFVHGGADESAPCACGAAFRPHPFHTHDDVPAEEVAALRQPLAALGASAPRFAVVRTPAGSVLFSHGSPLHRSRR
jgi:molybdopterin/thiamine biosynthesis adenylyltransferase